MRTTGDVQVDERSIAAAIGRCASSAKQVGAGRWQFALTNGATLHAEASMEQDWLLLDAAMPKPPAGPAADDAPGAWDLLLRNAALAGGAKFVFLPRRRAAHVRAEIPLDVRATIARRLRRACRGCKAALGEYRGHTAHKGPSRRRASAKRPGPKDKDGALAELCTAAGWDFAERAPGVLTVELDVPGDAYHALLARRTGRRVAVAVELASCSRPSEATRLALGLMLLTASGMVRMARAAAEAVEGRTATRFEAVLHHTPAPGELAHALSALSVACRLCGREARTLQDETVAQRYLSVRGWSS